MLAAVLLAVAAAALIGSLSNRMAWGGGGALRCPGSCFRLRYMRSSSWAGCYAPTCCLISFAAQSRQWACYQPPSPPHPAADYAAYVLLILSASCSLTHLAIGACVFVAATGRPARSFFRLLLSFEPLVGAGMVEPFQTICLYDA